MVVILCLLHIGNIIPKQGEWILQRNPSVKFLPSVNTTFEMNKKINQKCYC